MSKSMVDNQSESKDGKPFMLASPAQLKALNPVHIIRGVQLSVLGLWRALQNPNLFTSDHYKLAATALLVGLTLHFAMKIPEYLLRGSVSALGVFTDTSKHTWHKDLEASLSFLQHWVINVPFTLMNYFRNSDPLPFDTLFMESMAWVDHIYTKKHKGQPKKDLRSFYVPQLMKYKPVYKNLFYQKTVQRTGLGLVVYVLSFLPVLGKFVLPATSFYTLNRAIGLIPAGVTFSLALFVFPRHYFVIFLQIYLSTRSLTRQLLTPYFARVGSGFSTYQKAKWYREREGVLFGFALPFVLALRIPFLGVMFYGLASASAAFLVSKVTNPPPTEAQDKEILAEYVESEMYWREGRRNLVKAGWEKILDKEEEHSVSAQRSQTKRHHAFETDTQTFASGASHSGGRDEPGDDSVLTLDDDPMSKSDLTEANSDDWSRISQSSIS